MPRKKSEDKKPIVHREKELQEISIQFAENVLYLCRTNPNLKIGHLEDQIGFKRGYIAQYANGTFQRGMPIDKACQIAKILGEDVKDMMLKNLRIEDARKWQRKQDMSVSEIRRELGL